ncbi:diaminopimelate epimerase [Streptomyces malaysiensis]|uniref:diaminopimelate epimerase n=1 Tax=Streptomyces malaysiensis TaxID=92644 RepID=UPI000BFE0897|nr:diaminopimelate epimerase [Streptomyces malaysiensis]ATL85208.1 diaminopimelate epimerase [Streptomyces malaysiensis]QDL71005.1 diaminopimelate epimerase [Streptomyces malaysiensis]
MTTLLKYHTLGNDYLVADPELGAPLPGATATRVLCDRRTGIGADGVLYGPLPATQPTAGPADTFDVRVFNADGSECARNANGLRLFARYLREHGRTTQDEITLRTPGGAVSVRLGRPVTAPGTIDLGSWTHHSPALADGEELVGASLRLGPDTGLHVTAVHNGVPHLVSLVDDATPELAARIGPEIVAYPGFTERPNAELLTVEDRRTLRLQIWERGVGYAPASGSGACAAACAAYRLGLTDPSVTVVMPGGTVAVEITRDERVLLSGSSSYVGQIALADEFVPHLRAELPR